MLDMAHRLLCPFARNVLRRKGHIMKITYEFCTGEVTEVEVSDEIGAMIIGSRREEDSSERNQRRHCYSLDAITYEGKEYASNDFITDVLENSNGNRVSMALSHLTAVQKRRLFLLAGGLSVREIARREGKDFKTVYESIEAAKKKFMKFYK